MSKINFKSSDIPHAAIIEQIQKEEEAKARKSYQQPSVEVGYGPPPGWEPENEPQKRDDHEDPHDDGRTISMV